ncbi:MAG: toxic anion resistance protein [Lachnospiraceae bacterium]|nr:toxic anion resistance protein [Lachnospiraceae bacterium]
MEDSKMSEVIDAQVVGDQAVTVGQAVAEKNTADPLAQLLATPQKAPIVETREDDLSPEDRETVEKFVSQIDIKDSQMVLQYGAAAQKNVAEFSEGALASVKTKDMGEIGSMLTGVVTELKGFSVEEQKGGFLGLFKKTSNQLTSLKAKYDKAEVNVNKISKAMEGHQQVLLKDVAMLDKMYEENLDYFKQLSLYIIAGKKKLDEAKTTELPRLLKKAEETGLQEDSQEARDYAAMIERFEKKIYDLELTRNISMQMAPQIRLIQNNDTVMAEKIQSTLVNTIPLWKSQMVIAIGLDHSQDAAKAQKEVTDMTNELLKKNAEALKIASVESAKESERGIVDIETLTETNRMLIETFDEVMKIQADGRQKRLAAETELNRIETEMKDKILQISRESLKVE